MRCPPGAYDRQYGCLTRDEPPSHCYLVRQPVSAACPARTWKLPCPWVRPVLTFHVACLTGLKSWSDALRRTAERSSLSKLSTTIPDVSACCAYTSCAM